ncbi:MAG: pyrimidine/purine nucleoside phosphorylase [Candidatus Omnitrophica bacterium]|nr:pyrimidine/purine nucleoside phosphorylase [Candidatus Omnitrophota bacterium]
MVEVNEYFEGKVKSLTVNSTEGKKTVGVMAPGEYEFTTGTKETMKVITGTLNVYFPEENDWEEFGQDSSFEIPAQTTFKVKVEQDSAYLCEYE